MAQAPHDAWLRWHRRILATRHAEIVPRLAGLRRGGEARIIGEGAVAVRWRFEDRPESLRLAANLSALRVEGFPPRRGRRIWDEGEDQAEGVLAPWSIHWSIEEERA
jgi:hypothetical protein